MGRKCHPLLRGGRRETKYSHGFSASDMETLTSICEVILPSLPLNSAEITAKNEQSKRAIQSFYNASGSQYPIPDEVNITRV